MNEKIRYMWLSELTNLIVSKEFRRSEWAVECLFPDVTRNNINSHPLVVAERVTVRKKAVLLAMIISPLIIPCGLYGVSILGERTPRDPEGLLYFLCFLAALLAVFISGHSLLKFLMSPEERRALCSCREHLALWEQFLNEKLTCSIGRTHSSMEYMVEKALTKTAKELIKIERENMLSREAGNLSSLGLDLERRAKKQMEDFHGLVRFTNLVSSPKWDIYFQMAREELTKEETAKKSEQKKRGKPVCEGCGG